MSKLAQYIQQHIMGEVTVATAAREHFSTDASIFKYSPVAVVYPKNEVDVRKVCKFLYALAQKGKSIPLITRGSGTDLSGAAIGNGIILNTTAHMNKILGFDSKSWIASVQPGTNFGKLQQALITHYREIPVFPASIEYSTIGGAVANNSAGDRSIKYGPVGKYVSRLKVVLSNGDIITTGRISKKELNKKKGLSTFEGDIYRSIDGLLMDNEDLILNANLPVLHNNAGYNLADIKNKDGSIDLTPLFVGSQGTLGIITELELSTVAHNIQSDLVVATFENLSNLIAAAKEIVDLEPSMLEMINETVVQFIKSTNPKMLTDFVAEQGNCALLLIEFDDASQRSRKKKIKRTKSILEKYAIDANISTEPEEKDALLNTRQSISAILAHQKGISVAVPLIDDCSIPSDKVEEFIKQASVLLQNSMQHAFFWGSPVDGRIHSTIFADLSSVTDKQRIFKLATDYYRLAMELGGSTSSQHNDGRLRGMYLTELYGEQYYNLLLAIKNTFDPYRILNPGVKVETSLRHVLPNIRSKYSMEHLYDHLPRI